MTNAATVADLLQQTLADIRSVYVCSSILDQRLCDNSDLDLLVNGLPALVFIEVITLAETAGLLWLVLHFRENLSFDLVKRLLSGS